MMLRRPAGGKAAVALAREAAPGEAARAAALLSCTESCRDANARQGFSRVLVPRPVGCQNCVMTFDLQHRGAAACPPMGRREAH